MPANTPIIYEFPLNERIRIFIRLELLFKQLAHFLDGNSVSDRRAALDALLDILTIFSRNDLKSETLKELDRHAKVLTQLARTDGVDTDKVDDILADLTQTGKNLYAANGKIGVKIMESDLFQSISQRSSIPGGTCSFDLPAFHFWLEQEESVQRKALEQWTQPFADIHKAITLILGFIRQSTTPSRKLAQAGFFQMALDRSLPLQLLRISVARDIPCFAEISGGKHRFTIRFMTPSNEQSRPLQSSDDIPFDLTCCQF
ncbi:MAG: cell division protein ZapD [Gammaproteobacteria bacterium HGW-Gammaproteobacteria-3]|nr:MAG: cell division protein ZapD [Gammaproteobacteria bacterium HGW-Gammaproteobacteria-3]